MNFHSSNNSDNNNLLSNKAEGGSLLDCINGTTKYSLTTLDNNIDVTAKQNVDSLTHQFQHHLQKQAKLQQ